LRLFSFGGYGLALAALALVVFGAIECPPFTHQFERIWHLLCPFSLEVDEFITRATVDIGSDLGRRPIKKIKSETIK